MRETLVKALLRHRIVVILRGIKPEEAIPVCETLAETGVRFMEIPMNTPDALASIDRAAGHFGDGPVAIGAGTVLTPDTVDAVARAGGKYILSPNVDAAVIERTRELGLGSIPGFATPTEAFAAIRAGADILKCFPCETPEKIAILKSVVHLPIFAVGGICVENRDAYLKTSDGLGVGIGIYHPGMPLGELRESASKFMQGIIPRMDDEA